MITDLLIIIVAVVVCIGGAGVAAWSIYSTRKKMLGCGRLAEGHIYAHRLIGHEFALVVNVIGDMVKFRMIKNTQIERNNEPVWTKEAFNKKYITRKHVATIEQWRQAAVPGWRDEVIGGKEK